MNDIGQNKAIVDEITTLRMLYAIRAYMQEYSKASSNSYNKSLIELYAVLAGDKDLSQKVCDFISSYVAEISFDPYAFKTTTKKDDKKADSLAKNLAAAKLLRKQIMEELEYKHSCGKMTYVKGDEIFESVAVDDSYFSVRIKGKDEPIKFKLFRRGKNVFSSLGVRAMSDDKCKGKGFNKKTFEFLSKLGEKGFVLDIEERVENLGKKYSPSQYKSYLGLSSKEDLSAEQKKELEILNSLAALGQTKFIIGVKERKIKQMQHQRFFAMLKEKKDIVKTLADAEELGGLFVEYGMVDSAEKIQNDFIKNYIQKDKKNIWSNFVKTDEDNTRFSYYDVLVNNLIAKQKDIFEDIYSFKNTEEMKEKLAKAYVRVKKLATPMLLDGLCGEILVRGIFNYAVNRNTNLLKLKNMNLLLNELGLNIKFVEKEVTKAPGINIENAAQQNLVSRAAFEKDKKTPLYKEQERVFQQMLDKLGIKDFDERSTHHYLALKNNPFIDEELNRNVNYVYTARQHPWNFDGHMFVHLFDTRGEFLVKDEEQKYSFMDFNYLRKMFNSGKKLKLQIPIVQVRGEATKEFRDLLSPRVNGKGEGFYISSDKTPVSFVRIPEYCTIAFENKAINTARLNTR